jgi:hypothetical protein
MHSWFMVNDRVAGQGEATVVPPTRQIVPSSTIIAEAVASLMPLLVVPVSDMVSQVSEVAPPHFLPLTRLRLAPAKSGLTCCSAPF